MYKLVLIRHGQSQWNQENRFTGWHDVPLSEKGQQEARKAGQLLKAEGFSFDLAHSSYLKRAISTLWILLEELDLQWIPVNKHWRLNERHYGSLQGLNKAETTEKYGEDQVFTWRRSYDTPPPAMETDHPQHPKNDPRYQNLDSKDLPNSEALLHCKDRVLPYWKDVIAPQILESKKILIAAHGNSLRALVKHLDNVSNDEITQLNIPTGVPLVYELDQKLHPIQSYYLGDQEAVQKAAEEVARQGSSKIT